TERTSSISKEIEESISLDKIDDTLKKEEGNCIPFSISEYVEKVCRGDCELSLDTITEYIREGTIRQWDEHKTLVFRLLIYAVLSGIFLNLTGSLYEKQLGENGFHMLYFLVVTILLTAFYDVFSVAKEVLFQVLSFMKVLVPAFSLALTWSSGSATSFAFYQATLATIGAAETLMYYLFLPVIQIYFLLRVLNPLSGGKFDKLAILLESIVRVGTKIILGIMLGHQGIKGLLMPALDQVKRSAVFRAAGSLPGVGNVFGGITDTIVGSGILIKSAIGVGGIIAIALICLLPLLKLGVFTFTYRVMAAFSQPVADRRMVAVFQGSADSGKLLFELVFMVAVLFLLTLTIIIAATN
ncbi:MAG: stage III sporulation protein AE, partial [Eubacterium sp.]